MTIANFISERTKKVPSIIESEQITIRLESTLIAQLDELVMSLDITRNALLTELIIDALPKAQKLCNEALDANLEDEHWDVENGENNEKPRFFLLNSCKRYSLSDSNYMINNGVAAAFDGHKNKINRLRKNDVVFLFENGRGIVGIGNASGKTVTKNHGNDVGQTHEQELLNYSKVKPFSAREIRKTIDRKLPYLATLFKLSNANDGIEIEKRLERIL